MRELAVAFVVAWFIYFAYLLYLHTQMRQIQKRLQGRKRKR